MQAGLRAAYPQHQPAWEVGRSIFILEILSGHFKARDGFVEAAAVTVQASKALLLGQAFTLPFSAAELRLGEGSA